MGGLTERSYYINKLNTLCEKDYNEKECLKYINKCIENNYSKRIQNDIIDLPEDILNNKYVFIPTQKHNDISLQKEKIGMFECIEKSAILCKEYNIPLVIKVHPHLRVQQKKNCKQHIFLKEQLDFIEKTKKNIYENIFISESSINLLIQNALFTTTINGTTIMDNFINQSIVLVLGKSIYSYTDGVIFTDGDLVKGFDIIFNKKFD